MTEREFVYNIVVMEYLNVVTVLLYTRTSIILHSPDSTKNIHVKQWLLCENKSWGLAFLIAGRSSDNDWNLFSSQYLVIFFCVTALFFPFTMF